MKQKEWDDFLKWWELFPHNPDGFSKQSIAFEAWKAATKLKPGEVYDK